MYKALLICYVNLLKILNLITTISQFQATGKGRACIPESLTYNYTCPAPVLMNQVYALNHLRKQ